MAQRYLNLLLLDIQGIQSLLQSSSISISALVEAYLTQIELYNPALRALISMAPRHSVLQVAKELDRELQDGRSRGPLHGVPMIIKDNIQTHPSMGMETTAGTLALLNARNRSNAIIVDNLIDAGAIIMGKSNMSELMNNRGRGMMAGWSGTGGQCISAYVRGGIDSYDRHAGHSSPGGSSTGSAVGVSAGFAPVSIGTETSGSLIEPGTRAALYTLKPTTHLLSQNGIVPVSHTFDTAGPMTKSVYDVAILMDVLTKNSSGSSYTNALKYTWKSIRVGTLNPADWRKEEDACEPNSEANAQMDREIRNAYAIIKSQCATFVENISLWKPDLNVDGHDAFAVVNNADFKKELVDYFNDLKYSQVHSFDDLIRFNDEHAEQELPPHHSKQDVLAYVRDFPFTINDAMYVKCLTHLRRTSREEGIDRTLKENKIDVIIGPADGQLHGIAASAGYPVATMPLSFLDLNGRPFGVVAMASANQEHILIEVMSAWEKTFAGGRRAPALWHHDTRL